MAIIAMTTSPSLTLSNSHDLRMNVSKNPVITRTVHLFHDPKLGFTNKRSSRSAIVAMTALVHKVIQPARDHFGPIVINPRRGECKELNELYIQAQTQIIVVAGEMARMVTSSSSQLPMVEVKILAISLRILQFIRDVT